MKNMHICKQIKKALTQMLAKKNHELTPILTILYTHMIVRITYSVSKLLNLLNASVLIVVRRLKERSLLKNYP